MLFGILTVLLIRAKNLPCDVFLYSCQEQVSAAFAYARLKLYGLRISLPFALKEYMHTMTD